MMDFTGFCGKFIMGSRFGMTSQNNLFSWGPVSLLLVVLLGAFWLWMIIDCLKRDFKKDMDKLVWVIVLLFANLVGAILYYFLVKAQKRRK